MNSCPSSVLRRLEMEGRRPREPGRTRPAPGAGQRLGREPDAGREPPGEAAVTRSLAGRHCDCLWVTELGGRIVGRIGVAHDGRHVVKLQEFHIDPEWHHTSVLSNLVGYVHKYCWSHGCLKLRADGGVVPSWLIKSLRLFGFHMVRERRLPDGNAYDFYLDLYRPPLDEAAAT